MNNILFNAILSMDSYNRGYNAGIRFGNLPDGESQTILEQLGNAIIITDSRIIVDSGDIREDIPIGFYAIAYSYNDETIISFRGTDNPPTLANPLTDDVFHGWSLGGGNINSEQAQMAVRFYQEVAGDGNWQTANISLTGHSLGGGLAGFVGGLYDQDALLFDSMEYGPGLLAVGRATLNPGDATYHEDIKQLIYGASTPWSMDTVGITATHIDGEALGFIRLTDSTPLEFGTNVDIFPASSNPVTDAVARHSMAALAIRLFATTEEVQGNDWQASARFFWPLLYSNVFAGQIGAFNVPGTLSTTGKFDEILRQVIAYSAINLGGSGRRAYEAARCAA